MKAQVSDSRRTFKPSDIVIAVIAAAILAAVLIFRGIAEPNGSSAAVFCSGEQIAALPLETDGVYPFDEYGVTVEVKNRSVRVINSDCPDKICEKTGFISSSAQTIVCLPNRISVRIIGNTDSNIDVVLN
ncbi:MAG: NusG domain II-containing protein [Oscillospiraceae bacterium]